MRVDACARVTVRVCFLFSSKSRYCSFWSVSSVLFFLNKVQFSEVSPPPRPSPGALRGPPATPPPSPAALPRARPPPPRLGPAPLPDARAARAPQAPPTGAPALPLAPPAARLPARPAPKAGLPGKPQSRRRGRSAAGPFGAERGPPPACPRAREPPPARGPGRPPTWRRAPATVPGPCSRRRGSPQPGSDHDREPEPSSPRLSPEALSARRAPPPLPGHLGPDREMGEKVSEAPEPVPRGCSGHGARTLAPAATAASSQGASSAESSSGSETLSEEGEPGSFSCQRPPPPPPPPGGALGTRPPAAWAPTRAVLELGVSAPPPGGAVPPAPRGSSASQEEQDEEVGAASPLSPRGPLLSTRHAGGGLGWLPGARGGEGTLRSVPRGPVPPEGARLQGRRGQLLASAFAVEGLRGCDLGTCLSPQLTSSRVGAASRQRARVPGECVDAMGVSGRDGCCARRAPGPVPAARFSGATRPGSPAGGFGWSPRLPPADCPPALGPRRLGRLGSLHWDLFQGAQMCAGPQTK